MSTEGNGKGGVIELDLPPIPRKVVEHFCSRHGVTDLASLAAKFGMRPCRVLATIGDEP